MDRLSPARQLARRDLVDMLRELHRVADSLGMVATGNDEATDLAQCLDEALYLLTTALDELGLVTRGEVR